MSRSHETCHHQLYSLTCDQYVAMLAKTGERCWICGAHASTQWNGKLRIDHDHANGQRAVRGLLCARCNSYMEDYDRRRRAGVPADDFDASGLAYVREAWIRAHRPELPAEE